MNIQFAREDNTLIAAVSGRIDGSNAHEFAESIEFIFGHVILSGSQAATHSVQNCRSAESRDVASTSGTLLWASIHVRL